MGIVQASKPVVKTPLRERNHLPRKRAVATGELLGIRTPYVALALLVLFALVWFLYGWWTYPVAS